MTQAEALGTVQPVLEKTNLMYWSMQPGDPARNHLAILHTSLSKIATELQKDDLVSRSDDFSVVSKEFTEVILPTLQALDEELQKDVDLYLLVHDTMESLKEVKSIQTYLTLV